MTELYKFGRILVGDRKKGHQFSSEGRAFILGAVAADAKRQEIADAVGTTRSHVAEVVKNFRERRTLEPLPRPGRPPIIAQDGREERRLQRIARQNPQATYSEVRESLGTSASAVTVKRSLRRNSLRKRRGVDRKTPGVEAGKGEEEVDGGGSSEETGADEREGD